MHLDSTIAALKSADGYPPVDAVQSAIALAETLAPAISGVLDLAASGGTLTKDEENLIFSGLYALAEARCASVFPALLRFLNGPSMTIEGVFDEDFMHLSGLLVSLADTDTAPLFALARNGDILEEVRSAAISALARLVWEGRADPDAFVSVLDDFDREQARIPAVFTYFAWAEAILSLRLRALIPRVRKAFEAELLPFDELDWQEWLDEMEKPEQHFAAEPIDSAETALSFFKEREPHALEISPGRLGWLSRALLIPAATGQCLPFEMVDGFFTGVACGPPPRPSFADVIGEIWTETTPEEIFRRTEVQQDVEALLRQRFYSIGRRLAKGIPPNHSFPTARVRTAPGCGPGDLPKRSCATAPPGSRLLRTRPGKACCRRLSFRPGHLTGANHAALLNCGGRRVMAWVIWRSKSANSGPMARRIGRCEP